jgi:hypothetical protein
MVGVVFVTGGVEDEPPPPPHPVGSERIEREAERSGMKRNILCCVMGLLL